MICKRLRYENETKLIRYIAWHIVPLAEILADRGATNVSWINAKLFPKPLPISLSALLTPDLRLLERIRRD
jgi:hypothetical protein